MTSRGLLNLDTQKCFHTRKERLETRREAEAKAKHGGFDLASGTFLCHLEECATLLIGLNEMMAIDTLNPSPKEQITAITAG